MSLSKLSITAGLQAAFVPKVPQNCSQLEPIGQFETKIDSVLLDGALDMEPGGGDGVLVVQQIIDAHGGIQVFDQVLAEEGEIDSGVSGSIRPGKRIPGEVGENRMAGTGILEFQPGKDLVLQQRGTDIEFDQVHGRIRQAGILSLI